MKRVTLYDVKNTQAHLEAIEAVRLEFRAAELSNASAQVKQEIYNRLTALYSTLNIEAIQGVLQRVPGSTRQAA